MRKETNFKMVITYNCELEALKTCAVSNELTISESITVGSLIKSPVIGTHSRDPEQEA